MAACSSILTLPRVDSSSFSARSSTRSASSMVVALPDGHVHASSKTADTLKLQHAPTINTHILHPINCLPGLWCGPYSTSHVRRRLREVRILERSRRPLSTVAGLCTFPAALCCFIACISVGIQIMGLERLPSRCTCPASSTSTAMIHLCL